MSAPELTAAERATVDRFGIHTDQAVFTIRIANPPKEGVIQINGADGRPLLVIHSDGRVEGEIEDASEAARVFMRELRKYAVLEQSTPHPDGDRATAESVLSEVERRLRERDGYAAEDCVRTALLHIDAYRAGRARRLPVVETVTEWGVRRPERYGSSVMRDTAQDRAEAVRSAMHLGDGFDPVKREVHYGPWLPVEGGEADTWRDPAPWYYPVSGTRTAHHLAQTGAAFLPRTREQFEQEALAGLTIRKETEA